MILTHETVCVWRIMKLFDCVCLVSYSVVSDEVSLWMSIKTKSAVQHVCVCQFPWWCFTASGVIIILETQLQFQYDYMTRQNYASRFIKLRGFVTYWQLKGRTSQTEEVMEIIRAPAVKTEQQQQHHQQNTKSMQSKHFCFVATTWRSAQEHKSYRSHVGIKVTNRASQLIVVFMPSGNVWQIGGSTSPTNH